MPDFKIADLADAIEKNNYPKVKGHLVKESGFGVFMGACALGQGLLNLGVSKEEIVGRGMPPFFVPEIGFIVNLNDRPNLNYKVSSIGRMYRRHMKNRLDETFHIPDAYMEPKE